MHIKVRDNRLFFILGSVRTTMQNAIGQIEINGMVFHKVSKTFNIKLMLCFILSFSVLKYRFSLQVLLCHSLHSVLLWFIINMFLLLLNPSRTERIQMTRYGFESLLYYNAPLYLALAQMTPERKTEAYRFRVVFLIG